MNSFKAKFTNRELIKGMHTTLSDASVTEMCALVGFDFIWIDTEHSALDYYTLQTHLIAAKAGGTHSLVRIPWNDPILAKRVLEMGPDGIIFPVINTAEELDAAMKSTLYPPHGTRGFGPVRAVKYGLSSADEFINKESLDMVRCVQIESAKAVENLPQMVKNPWVDCFIFGPCDLSGSIGELNNVEGKRTQDLLKKAIDILQKANKSIGVSFGSTSADVIKGWHDMGINMVSAGTDYMHIVSGAKRVYSILQTLD
ncbi:MAG: HpcH/HpaI aldolase family protein [Sphaerochaetaceae bacterium]